MKYFKNRMTKVAVIFAIPFALSVALSVPALADNTPASHNVHVVATSTHSVQVGWRAVGPNVKDEVLVYNASTKRLVIHTRLEAGHSTSRTVNFGTGFEGQALAVKIAYEVNGHNTGWSKPLAFYVNIESGATGPQGPKGDTGATGPQGPAGSSGIVSTGVKTLIDAPMTVHTGGSFTSQEQLAATLDLKPGTYLVTLNAKIAWASGTGVFPQLFVYNGTPAADFSNNLVNIGNGALADGNASIDSYYNGSFQITVTENEAVNIYAFGYDQDRGSGTYTLENLQASETQLQVAAA